MPTKKPVKTTPPKQSSSPAPSRSSFISKKECKRAKLIVSIVFLTLFVALLVFMLYRCKVGKPLLPEMPRFSFR